MTLGTYPDGVPRARSIAAGRVRRRPYPLPRFTNVAAERRARHLHGLSGGAVIEDLDGDGLLDVMVSAIGFGDQMRVFRNDGAGTFAERTAASGPRRRSPAA